MKSPSLRFILHQPAIDAFKAEPPPPVVATEATRREHKEAMKAHYLQALTLAIGTAPTRYHRRMFSGIINRLKGRSSAIAKPLFTKQNVMPHMRPWAEKHGLL